MLVTRSPLAATLCLLVAMVQAAVAGRGLVLCVEPWGAVNIETTGCADCPDVGGEDADREWALTAAEEGCACIDVVIDSSALATRLTHGPADVQALSPASGQPSFLPDSSPPLAELLPDAATTGGTAARDLVGTVVLRV